MNANKKNIIAIDGPVGAGKSTVAGLIAKKMGYVYINSGPPSLALTLAVLRKNVSLSDIPEIIKIAEESLIEVKDDGDSVFLDGEDVSSQIRASEVDRAVPEVAKIREAREEILKLQHEIASKESVVAQGTAIGAVVFPAADFKFYLDASLKERAKRRCEEVRLKGDKRSLEVIMREIKERDRKDVSREHSPLKKSDDAIVINTTDKGINEVVEVIMRHIKKRQRLIGR